ncbi:penicillin acylase family protein [Gymnodinialimonas ceratoperidinii]|uniref:Penicillin acylase family protein n=1 Tax=Gymnodinialimonas ceratoperidinii TaxID=2856823 RepID=A0A8F6YBM0_9RHOB|nr:penicillin acylase family protein [Gymnodinialimonas ceratoperidinii]QXT38335.1 penicillin acylase family protein [Gymnodinialimonas ceratoperidinii]
MMTLLRWLTRLVGVGIAVVVLIGSVFYWMAGRSIPDYDADWTVPGLNGQVEIVRNTAAVPHIFALTDHDAYFGLGFSHAQDRLWQMLLLRRQGQGRLSEIFGRRTLEVDDLMRRLDLDGYASRSLPAYSDESRAILQAYADGVNAWLRLVGTEALGRGAPELFLFEPEIAPWRPNDSVLISLLMALQMTTQHESEILRARASLALPDPARITDLMPDAPGNGAAELGDFASLLDLPRRMFAEVEGAGAPRDPLHPNAQGLNRGGASNVWAATPARSAAGGALMATDPHVPLTAPSQWYLARLELATGAVIGATIPGMPNIINGRSERLSWGLTAAYMDDVDLYIEEVNPQNPTQYRTPDGWADFETRREIIEIADEAPITITLRETVNGPVIPGRHWNAGSVTPAGHVMSMRWTALTDENTTIQAGLRLMRARSIEEALESGEDHVAPAANLMLAAEDGRIAMQVVGHMPWRLNEHETQARMPSRGWVEGNLWQGTTQYFANPTFEDPESGVLGNTNNKMVERAFPLHVSFNWGDTQRIQRLGRLMEAREVHTRDSFIGAQLDTVSPAARNLLPLVARDLWFTGQPAAIGTTERLRQRALELLADWNGEMNEHLPEPLIFAAWMRALQHRLIRDDIGPLAEEFWQVEPVFLERVFRNIGGASEWCDVRPSNAVETCNEIAELALDEALQELSESYGSDIESWRWGAAHEAVHEHPVLGETRFFSWIVNIRQATSGGDFTLNRAATPGRGPEPYINTHGAGYRGVYDFADPDSSVFIISTGQSGHPFSRHYDDMGELWRRGEYVPMTLDPELARAANLGITVLSPAR